MKKNNKILAAESFEGEAVATPASPVRTPTITYYTTLRRYFTYFERYVEKYVIYDIYIYC